MALLDLDDAKREFTRMLLAKEYKSQKMMDFMLNIWENADLCPEDAGWVLWVICDQYALGRANDPVTQHKYQSEFLELVKREFPERAHWVVSDSTHGISLLRGGFLDFWCECYRYANETVPCTAGNRNMRFNAHKWNAYTFLRMGEMERMRSVLDTWAALLAEDPLWSNSLYATIGYKQHLSEYHIAMGDVDKAVAIAEDIEEALDSWYPTAGRYEKAFGEGRPLLGSWEDFSTDWWPTAVKFSSALIQSACGLARIRRSASAERFIRLWLDFTGEKLNGYTETLLLLSCWLNRHDKEEISRMWSESQTNCAVGYVTGIAPELAEVIS